MGTADEQTSDVIDAPALEDGATDAALVPPATPADPETVIEGDGAERAAWSGASDPVDAPTLEEPEVEIEDPGVESDAEASTEPTPPIDGEADPEADPGPVAAALAALEQRLVGAFESRLGYDAVKEKQIDRLHDELVGHRQDLLEKIARPLVRGLVRLHDDMGRAVDSLRGKDPENLTPERFFKLIEGFAEDVEIVLSDHGVEPFEGVAQEFDPRRQTAIKKLPTTDSEVIGRVARSIRPGFERGDRIVQKERVEVYVPDRSGPA
jgi:molecular chaperone GrpE (heat shock protein)